MKEPRTLVLDEEGPTRVDGPEPQTFLREAPPDAVSSALSIRRTQIAGGAGFLVLFVGLVAIAWQEHRSSKTLRRLLEALRQDGTAVSMVHDSKRLNLEVHRPDLEAPLDVFSDESEAAVESRIQLETEAASALLANDYGKALGLYRALARISRVSVFEYVAAILEARVRCESERDSTGSRCP